MRECFHIHALHTQHIHTCIHIFSHQNTRVTSTGEWVSRCEQSCLSLTFLGKYKEELVVWLQPCGAHFTCCAQPENWLAHHVFLPQLFDPQSPLPVNLDSPVSAHELEWLSSHRIRQAKFWTRAFFYCGCLMWEFFSYACAQNLLLSSLTLIVSDGLFIVLNGMTDKVDVWREISVLNIEIMFRYVHIFFGGWGKAFVGVKCM